MSWITKLLDNFTPIMVLNKNNRVYKDGGIRETIKKLTKSQKH